MPAWWPQLQAAKYLGCAPWELDRYPYWRNVALCAMDAERRANSNREVNQ